MGFLDVYLDKSRLEKIPQKTKDNLQKLEDKLNQKTQSLGSPLDELMKEYGSNISDLISRLYEHFDNYKFSFTNITDNISFIYSISMEISQIVNSMWVKLRIDGMTPEQEKSEKVNLGKELVYFVWRAWNPLANVAKWMPFKQVIEKLIVRLLAGKAIESILDFLVINQDIAVSTVSFGKKKKSKQVFNIRKSF